jgi:Uma2 family endonuclease
MLLAFLLHFLREYVEAHNLGVVMGSRALVDISVHHGYEPDLLFIRRERRGIIGPESITAAPDLVVEIISPGSQRYDAYAKKDGYAHIGAPEYWLLDPDNEQAAFYQLREGQYVEIAPDDNGAFHSKVLPGLAIRPEWLWPDQEGNFEKVSTLLQKMQGGSL